MTDIIKAKQILTAQNQTCVAVSGFLIYKSTAPGIAPVMRWIEQGIDLGGFAVADKVIGRAAALLFCFCGVKCVHGGVVSKSAVEVLKKHKITCTYDTLVQQISNRAGTGICPMESAVAGLEEPGKAFSILIDKIRQNSYILSKGVGLKKILKVNKSKCPQNHPCPSVKICPVGALSQVGFAAPAVDLNKCIACGKCVQFCPKKALTLE